MIKVARVASDPFFMVVHLKAQLELMQQNAIQLTLITNPESKISPALPPHLASCQRPIQFTRTISPWQDLKTLVALYRDYKKHRYDLVHSNGPKAGLLSAIAGWLARVPIRLHTFTGQPWVNQRGLKRQLLKACDWLIIHLNTQCYADSFGQARFLHSQKLATKPRQVQVLGKGSLSGVDLARYSAPTLTEQAAAIRQQLGIAANAFVFAFVGRITSDKGIELLLQAMLEVRQRHPQTHLLLVGPLEPDGQDCLSLLELPELQACVHPTGFVSRPEGHMVAADVLVLPSVREGFGTVVLEAAALAKPTIASDIYGLNEAVQHQQTGLLFAPGCLTGLVQTMCRMIAEPQLVKRLGKAAQDYARTYFDSTQVNQRVLQEYHRQISKKRLSRNSSDSGSGSRP